MVWTEGVGLGEAKADSLNTGIYQSSMQDKDEGPTRGWRRI